LPLSKYRKCTIRAKGLLNDNCFDYGGGFGSIV
jgi:hypothetical protein